MTAVSILFDVHVDVGFDVVELPHARLRGVPQREERDTILLRRVRSRCACAYVCLCSSPHLWLNPQPFSYLHVASHIICAASLRRHGLP